MEYWKCPKCGRQFSKKGQFHSCAIIPIEDHFKNKPKKLSAIFKTLKEKIDSFGDIRIDAVPTSINFGGKSHFAVVFVLKDSLKLEFLLGRKINNSRISKIRGPTYNYYTYTIYLKSYEDINDQLLRWLKESYYLRNK
ncbi:MAG: DUF5655 domain-containing protein [Promethearchaeota archaeon]